MKLKLQTRDQILMQKINSYGVLSTRQITSICFNNIAQATVLRRLRLLQEAGFIINCGYLPDGAKVWSISKLGSKVINEKEPFRFSNRNTHHHDVCVADVRFTLENIGFGDNWTTDFEMKRNVSAYNREDKIIPDGIFVADMMGRSHIVALELELHAKSHARYRNLFIDYTFKDAISLIWYVVKDVSIIKPILKQWHGVKAEKDRWNHPQEIIFCEFNDLIENKLSAQIMNDAGEYKSLWQLRNPFKNDQPLSSSSEVSQSGQKVLNSREDQEVRTAPEFQMRVSSGIDSTPSTSGR